MQGQSTGQLWRTEAAERFPDLKASLAEADSPYQFWTDLWFEFEDAHDAGKRDRIAAIYDYARWCFGQPRGKTAQDDLATCVSVCFMEHIPENENALKDMPNWWTTDDVNRMRDLLSYHVGQPGYEKLLEQFKRG